MDTPTLLPCPFCGATDDDNYLWRAVDGEWENAWIECINCGAQGPNVAMQGLPIDNISNEDFINAKNLADDEASAAAASAWNQRSAWQPIETAPRDVPLRLWGKFWNNSDMPSREIVGQWHEGQSAWSEWCEPPNGLTSPGPFAGVHPTHWQPLPSPPPITPSAPHAFAEGQGTRRTATEPSMPT